MVYLHSSLAAQLSVDVALACWRSDVTLIKNPLPFIESIQFNQNQ